MKSLALLLGGVAVSTCLAAGTAAAGPAGAAKCRTVHHKHRAIRVCPKPKPPAASALPAAGTVAATIKLAHDLNGPGHQLDVGGGSVWVGLLSGSTPGERSVARIDPGSNAVTATIDVGPTAIHPIAFADGSVWATTDSNGGRRDGRPHDQVLRIDAATGAVTAQIDLPGTDPNPQFVTSTPGAVWIGNQDDGTVVRIDTATNTIAATVRVADQGFAGGPAGMTTANGLVWVAVPRDKRLVEIDPATNAVAGSVSLRSGPALLASDDTTVWATLPDTHQVARIDGAGRMTTADTAGAAANGLAVGFGSVWVTLANAGAGEGKAATGCVLLRIDPAAMKAVQELTFRTEFLDSVSVGEGSVWIDGHDGVYRVTPS
jgi:DNA-binding beta-propeller fold protein YncE